MRFTPPRRARRRMAGFCRRKQEGREEWDGESEKRRGKLEMGDAGAIPIVGEL
jgi:hypothetical protein